MVQLEKISVVVSGTRGLQNTADMIGGHLKRAGKNIPVFVWDGISDLPKQKPFILVVHEDLLKNKLMSKIEPDIVVIKELSKSLKTVHDSYLQLYNSVGPHMLTILNADDRAVVEFAGNEVVRKGQTYYFSKNSGLAPQIKKIGGVVSDGESVEIFGFNQAKESLTIKFDRIMGYDEEVSLLASYATVMNLGLEIKAISNFD